VATFALVLVTSLAFVAAYRAAFYALRTYHVASGALGLESSSIMAVARCQDKSHTSAIEFTLDGGRKVTFGTPDDEGRSGYYAMVYEFRSLGRTSIVNPSIWLYFRFIRRSTEEHAYEEVRYRVRLASLRRDDVEHVRLWISPDLLSLVVVEWVEDGARHEVARQRVTLEFHATPEERPLFRFVRRYVRPGADGTGGQPSTPPPAAKPRVPSQRPVAPTSAIETTPPVESGDENGRSQS
jgi:hypothetical protein